MARRYTIQANYAVSSAHDILRITSKVGAITRLIECHVTNDTDETSEMLPFIVQRATGNGTGTAVNPGNCDLADTSCSGSCAYNLSAPTTPGTLIHREACNILSGFHYVPTPEARPLMANGAVISIKLATAPTNTPANLSVNAVIEEEG